MESKFEGLLSVLIENIKKELQGLVRYEVLRGLDKPEANNWVWNSAGVSTFKEFLSTDLYNAIYPAEKITVNDYILQQKSVHAKFKFIKETGKFYIPSGLFLSQEFLEELISGKKQLFLSSAIKTDSLVFPVLKSISSLFYGLEILRDYIPSTFSLGKHDSEFVTSLFLTLDYADATRLYRQYCGLLEIQKFALKTPLNPLFFVPKLQKFDITDAWNCISLILSEIQDLKYQESQIREMELKELQNSLMVKDLANRNYNEDLFDRIMDVSDV